MSEHVNATAVFEDECNVARLKAIIACAKSGMSRAETARELGIHYTVLSHTIQALEIPFTDERRGPKPKDEFVDSAETKGLRRSRGMNVEGQPTARAQASRLVRAAKGLVASGYSLNEAARMYSLPPEALKSACANTRALAS